MRLYKLDNKDLNYLFNNSPHKIQNKYDENIITSTAGLQLNFLKNSNYKYKIRNTKRKYLKKLDILRVDGSRIGTVLNPFYPTTAKIGRELTNDKLKTELLLNRYGIKTPQSIVYDKDEMNLAYENAFRNNESNIVIKPLSSSLGRGVRVNVSKERFKHNWELSVDAIKERDKRIVVQNYLEGFEARVTVIEGAIESIVVRVPPNVKGDGTHSIAELVEIKNKKRFDCFYLRKMPIVVNERIIEFLLSHNLNIDYVPKLDEAILLNSVSNVSQGGELIEITDIVSDSIKETALNALAAIPGVNTGGLDVMMTSFEDENPAIIEINTYPNLAIPTYPTFGNAKNPIKSYFESIISVDQFISNPKYKYNIIGEKEYIRNYVSFMNRKKELLDKNEESLRDLIL